jgi:hypothetical protein
VTGHASSMTLPRWTCVIAFALAVWPQSAAAQTKSDALASGHWELWGGISAVVGTTAGDLTSSYSPPVFFGSDFTSHGSQTLTLDSRRGIGFEGGVDLFPTPHLGVQILVNRVSTDLDGTNGPYAIDLTYVSRQPPDSVPQTFAVQYSSRWPDTSGSLTQLTVAVNPVARLGRPDGLNATVSGGVSYYRLSGTAQPLGYTAFRLGGHSVLFSDEYHLAVSFEPANVIGLNAGGEINIPLGRRTAVVIGYRYLGGGPTDVSVRLSEIVNADQVANQDTPENIARRLAPGPARVTVSNSRILIGVKVKP